MPFELKKDKTKWVIAGTGDSWNLMPKVTPKTVMVLNDFIHQEKYGVQPDYLCIMDVLPDKPQIVSGTDNLGEVVARINKMGVPLISPFRYEEIPLSEPFPLQKCTERFGWPYFTNTICYMLAYALLQGAKEIDIYGVNQVGSHEYTEERGGVEYWIGIANGMGVKVTIHGRNSQLLIFKGKYGGNILYGYHQTFEQIIDSEQRFGEAIVKKLFSPIPPMPRDVRKVN